ncbi:MAG: outer membrane protein assembly factor BamD [Paramuribaculum sp.]|nr:outer membrane protein assembly factor BamD [Paramuribaculum sp.]
MKKYILIALSALILSSCGEYNRVLKSNDPMVKLNYGKKAFEQKKYVQATTVLGDIVDLFRGKEEAEDALYLLALSHYENKDYASSGVYFKNYYTRFPRGKYTELARFYCGYGYYLDSPDPQLDQSDTMHGIEELQSFLDYFPKSDKVNIAQNAIFELQDKLTLKELQNAQLYYNLGNYMGNNYESAIIVARNAIKSYPYSRYKEDLEMLVLKAKFQEADQSIEEKKADRFREVIDEYYSFINNYPDGPNRKEAENILKIAMRYAGE